MFMLTKAHCLEALQAILEKEGARNLVGELHRLMNKQEAPSVAALFDTKTAGMVFGPTSVVRGLVEAAECGTADNFTYHFAMTAIVYAMALEKLDPGFFKEGRHSLPKDHDGYEAARTAIKEYVLTISPQKTEDRRTNDA
jgi:hypothetical protein